MSRFSFGKKIFAGIILLYAVAVGFSSCSKKPTGPKNQPITFNGDILPIFQSRCATAGCHNSTDTAGGMVFESFQSIQESYRDEILEEPDHPIIIPGDAQGSHIVGHLLGTIAPKMPPPPLPSIPSDEINKIIRWINEGAKGPSGEPFLILAQGKVYVANSTDGTVDIIDLSINRKVGSILVSNTSPPGIAQTHHIVVSPDKNFLYVTNAWSQGDVVKIDAQGDSVISRVRAGFQPSDIVISPDGQFVYTTDYTLGLPGTSVVRKFNTPTMSLADTFPIGKAPHGVAIKKDGSLVLAPSQFSDDCWFIYPGGDSTFRLKLSDGVPNNPATTSSFYGPFGIVLSKNDSLAYISCTNNNQIRVIEISTRTVVDSILLDPVSGKTPYMMALGKDSTTLYAPCWGSNTVAIINLLTKSASYVGVGRLAHAPALTKDGNFLYVTCEGDHINPYFVFVLNTVESPPSIANVIQVGRFPNGIVILEP